MAEVKSHSTRYHSKLSNLTVLLQDNLLLVNIHIYIYYSIITTLCYYCCLLLLQVDTHQNINIFDLLMMLQKKIINGRKKIFKN